VTEPPLLYLDQNYLSGIAKRKPAFRELEPVLRAVIAAGAVAVVESAVHRRESAPRPDLGLLELLRSLSGGRVLRDEQLFDIAAHRPTSEEELARSRGISRDLARGRIGKAIMETVSAAQAAAAQRNRTFDGPS